MNYRIQQAGPNIYEGLFGLLGTIMGNNARQRNDSAIADTLTGVNSWQPEQQQQGLLQQPQPQPIVTPTGEQQPDLIQQAIQPQEQPQQQIQQALSAPNKNNIRAGFGKDYALAMKELVGKRGVSAKEAKALIDNELNSRVETMYTDQSQKYQDGMLEQFTKIPNMDEKQAYMWALSAKNKGLPVDPEQFAKVFALKKLESLNLGDRYQMIDPYKEGTYDIGISPTAKYNKETVSADAQYRVANAPVRGSGGSVGSDSGRTPSNNNLSKEENWALTYESGNQLTNDQATIDTLYELDSRTPSQERTLQQAMARRDHYFKVSQGDKYYGNPQPAQQPQEQPAQQSNNDGASWYDQTWRSAVNQGLSPEQATAYMTYIIKKSGG